ncbi:MAG: methyltransferase domain-containing protein [Patescibacteria group bacterium]
MPYNTVMFNVPAILKRLDIKHGYTVADLGTGREARMALAAAKLVGEDGIVYAADVVKSLLPAVMTKAAMYGFKNVRPVWTNLEIYGAAKAIADNSVDVAFIVTVLFQSKKQAEIIKEAMRVLKPGGRLAIIDWKKNQDSPIGPAMDRRINPESIKQIAEGQLGMRLQDEFDAGKCHWGLIFVK